MTIKEKAKAYDEAIKRAKEYNFSLTGVCAGDVIQDIFPELKESEDEKIRQKIRDYLYNELHNISQLTPRTNEFEEWIAWLEKQGEPTEINPSEFDSRLNSLLKQFESLPKEELTSSLSFYLNVVQNDGTYKEEEQGEQKPVNKAKIGEKYVCVNCPRYTCFITGCTYEVKDSFMAALIGLCSNCFELYEVVDEQQVEPKFKVGDWIVRELDNTCYKIKNCILNVTTNKYGYDLTNGGYISSQDANFYHLWTIQDAKDGDVLAYVTDEENLWTMIYWSLYEPYEGHVYYHALLINDNFSDKGTCCICVDNLKPATKEQRDLLFQKMHEVGYEWDAEKKKLKKIEQKLCMIQWKGDNLKEVIGFTGKDKNFEKWFKSFEEYEKYVCDHSFIFKLFNEDGSHYEVPVGAWIVKTPDGYNVASKAVLKQKSAEWSEEDEKFFKTALWHISYSISNGKSTDIHCDTTDWLKSLKDRYAWKPNNEHYELEEFAKIVRGNLTGISKAVQKLFEAKYLRLTGNKMYGGFKD